MQPRPVVLGLTLCDYLLVEERTKKVSLIGTFQRLSAPWFPTRVTPFSVFATLTGGLGSVKIELVIVHMETNEELYSYPATLTFPDRVAEVAYHLRLRQCIFPAPGNYQFTLLLDGEWMAQRHLRVYEREVEG